VVEAVGDMVLRNGEKVVCLKLRRDPAMGLEYIDYSTSNSQTWWVQPPIGKDAQNAGKTSLGEAVAKGYRVPGAKGAAGAGAGAGAGSNVGAGAGAGAAGIGAGAGVGVGYGADAGLYFEGMGRLPKGKISPDARSDIERTLAMMAKDGEELGSYAYAYTPGKEKISLELASNKDITKLESAWDSISRRNWDLIGSYQPYYSVDSSAQSGAQEMFHLRVGPVPSIQVGDNVCGQLSRRGLNCKVVRTQ
jgi:hypothetical protein